jgi:hypothetical protein
MQRCEGVQVVSKLQVYQHKAAIGKSIIVCNNKANSHQLYQHIGWLLWEIVQEMVHTVKVTPMTELPLANTKADIRRTYIIIAWAAPSSD